MVVSSVVQRRVRVLNFENPLKPKLRRLYFGQYKRCYFSKCVLVGSNLGSFYNPPCFCQGVGYVTFCGFLQLEILYNKDMLITVQLVSIIILSSPGHEDAPRGGRRDSLSPDSAAEESSRKGRRDSSFGASSDKVTILRI